MVVNKDTLPFKPKMIVSYDTIRESSVTHIKCDTEYDDPCQRFDKINGKIVNRTDSSCLQQGLWITTDKLGNYSTSVYVDGDDFGEWKEYSKSGKLLKEMKEVGIGKDHFIVREIDYLAGKPVTIINKPLFGFYIKNFTVVVPMFVLLAIFRILLNYQIYNIENETNYSSFRNHFKFEPLEPGELKHRLVSVFTLWFFRYKPENKYRIIISNILSVLFLGVLLYYYLV
jgi:hypothetical protein